MEMGYYGNPDTIMVNGRVWDKATDCIKQDKAQEAVKKIWLKCGGEQFPEDGSSAAFAMQGEE